MPVHELAGKPAPRDLLIDVADLENAYYRIKPDVSDPAAAVSFGTSGHRGCSLDGSFNEDHILAISQAICEYRSQAGITGPVYLGKDTHALSAVAQKTAVEVLAANNVNIIIHRDDEVTPTPVISHAILTHNRAHERKADGIIITPSHNPPRDGGFKYNPPDGGPAGSDITSLVQNRANELLKEGNAGVRRIPCEQALQ
ncbi:MAG TPA: phosphoglucomutase, alpha-D-glucose phosphate-specific, partial [Phycisphaeraceae bacterium]|nr:phosphoglucomutase, alpha-D-glucose phosphate-specific [Phycisphaeraceae bacterium]